MTITVVNLGVPICSSLSAPDNVRRFISFQELCIYFIRIKEIFFLNRELSLINTCCWRADHEMLMHDGEAGVH